MNNQSLNNKFTIFVLDDDVIMARILKQQLSKNAYRCTVFSRTDEMLNFLEHNDPPDLFVLDYALDNSRVSGLDVCRKVKAHLNIPVLMLTANSSTEVIVSCLNAGADQYVTKPYHVQELIARIEAVTRLYYGKVQEKTLPEKYNAFSSLLAFTWQSLQLSGTHGRNVTLTKKEMSLLELFLASEDGYIDRRRAFYSIYGYEMDSSVRSIDLLVSRLRKKVTSVDSSLKIKSSRGTGYTMIQIKA
jgi:two-component system, OmpR family, response regulator VicR